jgi:hypothetical protein
MPTGDRVVSPKFVKASYRWTRTAEKTIGETWREGAELSVGLCEVV